MWDSVGECGCKAPGLEEVKESEVGVRDVRESENASAKALKTLQKDLEKLKMSGWRKSCLLGNDRDTDKRACACVNVRVKWEGQGDAAAAS